MPEKRREAVYHADGGRTLRTLDRHGHAVEVRPWPRHWPWHVGEKFLARHGYTLRQE